MRASRPSVKGMLQKLGESSFLKLSFCLAISVILLVVLLAYLDTGVFIEKWQQIVPGYALFAVVSYLGHLIVCGLRLRYLAHDIKSECARPVWIRLAALHHMLFTVMPSGIGDAGFPVLASRLVRCSVYAATRILLTYRIQDLWMLAILAGTGFLLRSVETTLDPVWLSCGLALAAACLFWATDLTRLFGSAVLATLGGFGKEGPGTGGSPILSRLQSFAAELNQPAPGIQRIHGTWTTILSWALVAASVWSLFEMIDVRLTPGEVLLVVAGMNLVGAVAAFTVAGLGVGESGLAAILVVLGFTAVESVAVALIVRPAAVLMVLVSGGLLEASYQVLERVTASTTPKAGTEGPRE